jgi:FkbM family methyltransferase
MATNSNTSKYAHALRHGWSSLVGWTRTFLGQPGFAVALLRRRWRYFTRREFKPPFETPRGFNLETPDALITYWCLFIEQELHHPDWVNALKAASRPLVVDVGANVGLFSHLVFCLNPRAEIVAFEPLPDLHERLDTMAKRTGADLTLHRKAAGRSRGEATLESPHGYDGVSRICVSGEPQGRTFRVPVTTLDQELPGRDVLVMKMDVEGFECEVIAGASQVLARTKFLIIEAQTPEHRDAITRALGPGWTRSRLGPADYLFCRK